MSTSAWLLGLAQIPFIINFFWSIKKGRKVEANHWEATTLDWACTTSPPLAHGNFKVVPEVHRGPYDYSHRGSKADFLPQNQPGEA
jgi:cytochrome c oxidase subunit 1